MQLAFATRPLALSRAYRHRRARQELVRRIAVGRQHPAAVVMWPPSYAATTRIAVILDAAPGIDQHVREALLREAMVPEDAELRELSHRDRVAIVQALRTQHPELWELWGSPNPTKEATP